MIYFLFIKHTKMETKHRILVIGDGGVGKTAYIRKQMGKPFIKKYYETKCINIYEDDDCIWYDFPGQEKYGLHTIHLPIDSVIYMYDVTNKLSFDNISFWKKYVKEHFGIIPSSITIGNKIDLHKYIKVKNYDVKNSNI